MFVAEGVRLAREALRAGASVELAIHSEELGETVEGRDVLRNLAALGVPVHTCADDVLGKTAFGESDASAASTSKSPARPKARTAPKRRRA